MPVINGLRWIALDCLPHQVGATRRTLAACLLRASLAAAGRGRCAHALHRWAVAVHAHERIRTVLDVRTANKAAEVRSPLIAIDCPCLLDVRTANRAADVPLCAGWLAQ